MAKRIGKRAQRRAEQLTFDPTFSESDAADAEEQQRVLKLMADAVAAAVATGGERIGAGRQFRLAVMLKQIHFCGGTKKEGSKMRIGPKETPDGKSLTEKLGPLAVSRRMIELDLALLAEWGFLEVMRYARGVGRRLKMDWIGALVADAQHCAWEAKTLRMAPEKIAHGPPKVAHADGICFVRNVQKLRMENKSALKSLDNRGPPTPVRWGDVVALVGHAAAQAALESLPDFQKDFINGKRRRGEEIPDVFLDRLLEACEEVSDVS